MQEQSKCKKMLQISVKNGERCCKKMGVWKNFMCLFKKDTISKKGGKQV